MMKLLPWVFRCETLALGLWLGSILFFSVVTAPTAFAVLDRASAGVFIRSVFPRYYMFGIVCGLVTVVLAVCAALMSPMRVTYVPAVLAAAMLATTVYARQGLMPKVDAHREARADAEPGSPAYAEADARFKAAHRLSVILNSLVFLVGLAAFVVAMAPTSATPPEGVPAGSAAP